MSSKSLEVNDLKRTGCSAGPWNFMKRTALAVYSLFGNIAGFFEPGHVHGRDEQAQPVRDVRGRLCGGGLVPRRRPRHSQVSPPPHRPVFFRSPT